MATIKINVDTCINYNLILLDLLTNCFVDGLLHLASIAQHDARTDNN
jgi:hypothetical protein